jgi:hypothetical protein
MFRGAWKTFAGFVTTLLARKNAEKGKRRNVISTCWLYASGDFHLWPGSATAV